MLKKYLNIVISMLCLSLISTSYTMQLSPAQAALVSELMAQGDDAITNAVNSGILSEPMKMGLLYFALRALLLETDHELKSNTESSNALLGTTVKFWGSYENINLLRNSIVVAQPDSAFLEIMSMKDIIVQNIALNMFNPYFVPKYLKIIRLFVDKGAAVSQTIVSQWCENINNYIQLMKRKYTDNDFTNDEYDQLKAIGIVEGGREIPRLS